MERNLAIVLAKLDIDPAALAATPPLTETLERAEGGIPAVMAALRFSGDASVQAFLRAYDEASDADRKILPLEGFALLAQVDIPQLLGDAIFALQRQSANIVKIIAVSNHPRTMEARVKAALKPGGYKDRNAIDTALGFLPQPKGATTFIGKLVNIDASTVDNTDPSLVKLNPDEIEPNDWFPNLEDTQKLLGG